MPWTSASAISRCRNAASRISCILRPLVAAAQFLPRPAHRRTACGSRARTGCRCPGPSSAAGCTAPDAFSSLAELDDPAVQIGAAVAVGQAEADRAAAAPAGLAHPRDLGPRVARAARRRVRRGASRPRTRPCRRGRARRRTRAARRRRRACPAPVGRRARGAGTCGWSRSRAHPPPSPRRASAAIASMSSAVAGSVPRPRSPIT